MSIKKIITIKLPSLEYTYLKTAMEGLVNAPCKRSNCGTSCLCSACSARRVFPQLLEQERARYVDQNNH